MIRLRKLALALALVAGLTGYGVYATATAPAVSACCNEWNDGD